MLRIASIIRWLLVGAVVLLLAVPALAVTAGGRQIVEVDGESMTPTYQLGDLLLLRQPTEADLRVGNVVTAVDGNGDLYTHRVIETLPDGTVQLQGDGNAAPDPSPVGLEQLRGAVEMHLGQPWALLVLQLQQWPVRICLLAVVLGLALLPLGAQRPAAVDARPQPSAPTRPARARRGRRPSTGPAATGVAALALERPVPQAAPRITVVDGPDGLPRVRVSIDLDAAALAVAAAVAAPADAVVLETASRRPRPSTLPAHAVAVAADALHRPVGAALVPSGRRRRSTVPAVARGHRAEPVRGRRRAG